MRGLFCWGEFSHSSLNGLLCRGEGQTHCRNDLWIPALGRSGPSHIRRGLPQSFMGIAPPWPGHAVRVKGKHPETTAKRGVILAGLDSMNSRGWI
jgi:hypothetical protein